MRAIPSALQAQLEGGAVTVCRCWRLTRADGAVLGFTDHDADVAFDGIVHSATEGLDSSGDVTRSGFGVGGLEVSGALAAAGLDAAELAGGKYDFAQLSLWLVNWVDVAQRVLLRQGTLGEVTRADGAFRAEVRGPAQALETVRGRVFTHTCDADLGDARCGVDLSALARAATVVAVDGARLTVSGIGDLAGAYLANGVAEMTSGIDVGSRGAIVRHDVDGTDALLQVRSAFLSVAVGDTLNVTPGCDKRFGTCLDKFANALNFRGFPHLPGNDRAFMYARSSS